MERILKTARWLWMFGLVLITAFALYFPSQEQYKDEHADLRYVFKPDIHHNAAVLKPSHILSKLKVASSLLPAFLTTSAVLILRTPKFRLPYRSIIPLRLRLLLLFPIKYTSIFVSFSSRSVAPV
ncbi:hypothetical protein CHH75_02835 [Paenibacillus sp. 7541]|uniref:Uncharacterized protein n=1 Tax=Paenibacillus campinasensis TaxID=66347 RepID=A0A268F4E0_9BACL|nr:hypothetical protein CHH67_00515 [Paenibacillus campinasensis]PAK55212.1 hypothetical protein CHH75_02835 [Paenibacillus sp. 7541]